jgi:hypothetical protein
MIATGVASASAHGQATISTATAAINPVSGFPPIRHHPVNWCAL